jgi:hypothetical protein
VPPDTCRAGSFDDTIAPSRSSLNSTPVSAPEASRSCGIDSFAACCDAVSLALVVGAVVAVSLGAAVAVSLGAAVVVSLALVVRAAVAISLALVVSDGVVSLLGLALGAGTIGCVASRDIVKLNGWFIEVKNWW